jgi:hypothetical protein
MAVETPYKIVIISWRVSMVAIAPNSGHLAAAQYQSLWADCVILHRSNSQSWRFPFGAQCSQARSQIALDASLGQVLTNSPARIRVDDAKVLLIRY